MKLEKRIKKYGGSKIITFDKEEVRELNLEPEDRIVLEILEVKKKLNELLEKQQKENALQNT